MITTKLKSLEDNKDACTRSSRKLQRDHYAYQYSTSNAWKKGNHRPSLSGWSPLNSGRDQCTEFWTNLAPEYPRRTAPACLQCSYAHMHNIHADTRSSLWCQRRTRSCTFSSPFARRGEMKWRRSGTDRLTDGHQENGSDTRYNRPSWLLM